MADKIDYGFISIKDVFHEKWYKIPEYQRPYVWGKQQVTELLDDIMGEAVKENKEKEYNKSAKREYFLGSLVWKITETYEGETSFLEYELLDGQQRLTTLMLITAVIRDLTTDTEQKQDCQETIFQKANVFKATPERMHIVFGIRGDVTDFVDKYVKTDSGTNQVEELTKVFKDNNADINCRHMSEVILSIRDFFKDYTQEQLQTFYVFFKLQVKVIYIAANELEDAFHLFNVMNNRGIKLRNSDILKAKNLSMITDSKERLEYAEKWENIENCFGEDFDQFLEFVRMCLVKKKASYSLLKEFEDNIYNPQEYNRTTKERKKLEPILNPGKETLDCIDKYFNAYQDVFENNSFSVETKNKLNAMCFGIEADFWKAAVLHYYIKFKTECFDEFLDMLNRKFTSDWVEELYLTKRIENVCKIIDAIDKAGTSADVLNSESLLYNKEKLLERLNSDIYRKLYCRYILVLANFLLSGNHTLINLPDMISTEHILPQTPSETSEWVKNFTEEQREECTNKLGNLMLISRRKNSVLSNYDYQKKKEKYFKDNVESLALSTKIYCNYQTWTYADYEKNHREMIDLLSKYFGIV
jgi:uncharacterized protein with ParB-like and HNH nuclease domain